MAIQDRSVKVGKKNEETFNRLLLHPYFSFIPVRVHRLEGEEAQYSARDQETTLHQVLRRWFWFAAFRAYEYLLLCERCVVINGAIARTKSAEIAFLIIPLRLCICVYVCMYRYGSRLSEWHDIL